MKTRLTLLIIPALILSACSTTYYSSVPYDDVYYQGQTSVRNNQSTDPEYSEVEVYEGQYDQEYAEEEYPQQDQQVVENPDYYNDFDFYYNYLFSSRLRRFHRPYYSFGYYNNYYTNMYWYEMNPYMWGSSIYLNTNWMMPYEYAGWSGNFFGSLAWGFGGFNMGWPYYGSGWPYYGGYGGWPHYGYGHYGYNYYSPFYSNHGYYYNSRDSYSHYYQHRPNKGRNYNRPNRASNTFGDMYEKRVYASRQDRTNQGNNRPNSRDAKSFTNKSLSIGTPNTSRNRSNMELTNGSSGGTFSKPYSRLNNASGSSNIQEKVVNSNRKTYTKPQSARNSSTIRTNSRNNPNNKTVRSYNNATLKYSKPNTYKSPNSRSSNSQQYGTPQRYTNAGTRSNTPTSNHSSNNVVKSLKRVITSPSRSSRSYSSPTRSSGKPISISRSSSGNRSVSSPSRSSSKSYSSPSRSSSRSYSSPSRSSSSVSRSSSTTTRSSSGTSSSSSRGKRK